MIQNRLRSFRTFALPTLVSGFLMLGCTVVGPDYNAPAVGVEARFVGGASTALVEAAKIPWWKALNEPVLDKLLVRGLKQNLDIMASLERINAARAQLRQTGVNSQLNGGLAGQANRADSGLGPSTTATASADASYVFDLFGSVRRGVEQSQAAIGQAEFDAATVRLGYTAELVSSYLQARYFQNAAEISRQTIASQSRTLELVQLRIDAGDATRLELQQAKQSLDRSKADQPLLIANFERNVFRIATLLAEAAGPILAQLQRGARLPTPRRLRNAGVPADLIRNRPDIRAAERNLAAATAAIGVAEAQLYPSLVISGNVADTTTLSPNTGFDVITWSFGPAVNFPILNRGVLEARRDAAISQAKQAEIAWRNSVLNGVEDVQTSLSLTRELRRQVGSLQRVTDSSRQLLSLTRASYENGASPITDVLDAELALSNSRFSLLGAQRDLALTWVELQIAAGKGWLSE